MPQPLPPPLPLLLLRLLLMLLLLLRPYVSCSARSVASRVSSHVLLHRCHHCRPASRTAPSAGQAQVRRRPESATIRHQLTCAYVHLPDFRRRGAVNTSTVAALGPPPYQDVYFDQQELSFCQVHAVNNAQGHQVLTGQQLLTHCNSSALHLEAGI